MTATLLPLDVIPSEPERQRRRRGIVAKRFAWQRAAPMNNYWVCIMTGRTRVLYVGLTNDLERRASEHKSKLVPGFTRRYGLDRLVYFEGHADIREAIEREKQVKSWRREKKFALIESVNPKWQNLSIERVADT